MILTEAFGKRFQTGQKSTIKGSILDKGPLSILVVIVKEVACVCRASRHGQVKSLIISNFVEDQRR